MLNCRILIRLVALLALFVSFSSAKKDKHSTQWWHKMHQEEEAANSRPTVGNDPRLLRRVAESLAHRDQEATTLIGKHSAVLSRSKKSAVELMCSSRLNSMTIEFNGQRMRNWRCSLQANREPSAHKRANGSSSGSGSGSSSSKRSEPLTSWPADSFCSCHHDYECTEWEQYYFDYLSVTEKLSVNNTVDMSAYSSYCERAMLDATSLAWTCQIDEEILNSIDYFYNYGDSENKYLPANSHVNEAYCECSLEKKCKLHRVVSPAPSVAM